MATHTEASLRWGRTARWAVGLAIGITCLWLSIRGLDLTQMQASVAQANPYWIGLTVICVVAVALLKTARWRFLYPPSAKSPSLGSLFSTLMIAQMLNVLIPIRLGEVARIGLMCQEEQPASVTAGTIVVEKSLDMLAAGLLVLIISLLAAAPDWLKLEIGASIALSGSLLLAGLLALWRGRHWFSQLLTRVLNSQTWLSPKWRERALRAVTGVLDSLAVLTNPLHSLTVICLTTLSWLVSMVTILAMLVAFDLSLGWEVAVTLMLAIQLSNLVPTPPALIGIIGAVTEATLGWFDVPRPTAAAAGVLLNIVLVGPLVLMGGWAAWTRFLRLTQLARKERWLQSIGLGRRKNQ
jgi:uncharacterized protein (TIRG00374 family)